MKTVYEVLCEMLGEEQAGLLLDKEKHLQRINAIEAVIQQMPVELAEKRV